MAAPVLPSTYQAVLYLALTFISGLLFGVAIKKALTSFILSIIGAIIAVYVGISLPGISAGALLRFAGLLPHLAGHAPAAATGLPVLFLVGLALGLWKG
ncbi:MAG: hypothetical protein ACP5GG_04195 [Conexivisphaera sp.]